MNSNRELLKDYIISEKPDKNNNISNQLIEINEEKKTTPNTDIKCATFENVSILLKFNT